MIGSSTYVSVIPDLREIDLFEWQEMSKRDIAKKWPSQWAAWGADPARFTLPESGKTPVVDLWRRAETVWGEIRGAPPGFAAPSLESDACSVVEEADGDLEDPKCRCVMWRKLGQENTEEPAFMVHFEALFQTLFGISSATVLRFPFLTRLKHSYCYMGLR